MAWLTARPSTAASNGKKKLKKKTKALEIKEERLAGEKVNEADRHAE